jgi:ribosomal protein L7/L12
MFVLIVWVMGAALLLINIMLRTRILRLEARLRELSNPKEQLAFLRQQATQKEKVAAIKALRKQYPELSLIDANKMWQHV